MKFAHIADCHVGAYRDPLLKEINYEYFSYAIDECIKEQVSFVLIAGDLFNTAVPSIDALKLVTQKLKELEQNNIPVYSIQGSHDYSASGKSMIEVLIKAGLLISVIQGEVRNSKMQLTAVKGPEGISFSGLSGKKGDLEQQEYKNFDYSLLEKEEQLFFLFHTTIQEFAPKKELKGISMAILPKHAKYYAGGHVHYHFDTKTLNGTLAYPGPTCPNSFSEWEDLKGGSFIIGRYENSNISLQRKYIQLYPVKTISYDVTDKQAIQITTEIKEQCSNAQNAIILLRLTGELQGSLSDLNLKDIEQTAIKDGAKCVLRNTSGINTGKTEIVQDAITDINNTEKQMIAENCTTSELKDIQFSQISHEKQETLIHQFMKILSAEKHDGETTTDFEERIMQDMQKSISNDL